MTKHINDHRELTKYVNEHVLPETQFTTIFKRVSERTDIGDYFVIKTILRTYLTRSMSPTRSKIYTALQYSDEFQKLRQGEKTEWLNDFQEMITYYEQENV